MTTGYVLRAPPTSIFRITTMRALWRCSCVWNPAVIHLWRSHTDGDGVADSDFNIDLLNPLIGLEPEEDQTPSRGVTIKENYIGLDEMGRSRRIFDGLMVSLTGAALAQRNQGNIIGGHLENGLWLKSGMAGRPWKSNRRHHVGNPIQTGKEF